MSLTKEDRANLAESEFAVPGKRKLPMHDATHVRLAWDMVDRTQGLSDSERHSARTRILNRAKEMGIDTTGWHLSASVSMQAMAIELPPADGHPNRVPFHGVLSRVDEASDNPPGGAAGRRVVLPRAVAEAALPSLLGMAVDCTSQLDGHDRKNKVGIITGAEIKGTALEIEGFFYAKDFPEEVAQIRAEKSDLGFSYELDARIQDADADPWVIESCVFTGAAILYKDMAAYTTTSIAAAKEQEMELEELKKTMEGLAATVAAMQEQMKTVSAAASLGGQVIDRVRPHVDALNAAADAMDKEGIGSHPKAGHAGAIRRVAAHMAAEAVSGKVPHVYRDHDYLPDARVEAAKDDEAAKKLDAVNKALEDLGTKFADLQAKAFAEAKQPERRTLSPEIKTLMAKLSLDDKVHDGKIALNDLDKVLDAAGIKGTKAIETKLKLRDAGVIA